MKKVLILDHKKLPFYLWAWRWFKRLVKEGIIQGEWIYIIRFAKKGGSTEIPENLIRSLRLEGLSFSRNNYREDFWDIVCVLKNIDSLKWALDMKKRAKIGRLIVGPFISTLPTDNHSILEDSAIDDLIFLCSWHAQLYTGLARIKHARHHIWAAGVDTDFWAPDSRINTREKKTALIYLKTPQVRLQTSVETELKKRGFTVTRIQCGFYDHAEYLQKLHDCQVVVFISQSETQGLAIFEAWSCDVPTLHWDRGFMDYYGQIFPGSSSAPYLTKSRGESFQSEADFPAALDIVLRNDYSPRAEMLMSCTLQESALEYLKILELKPKDKPL